MFKEKGKPNRWTMLVLWGSVHKKTCLLGFNGVSC